MLNLKAMVLVLLIGSPIIGCAHLSQTQYFEVTGRPDPVTGCAQKSYYKMTVEGRACLSKTFNMQAAYLSKAATDALQGRDVAIPIVEIPNQNQPKYDQAKDAFLRAAVDYAAAKAAAPAGSLTGKEQEERMVEIARQVWFTHLNDGDLVSIGATQKTDPYQFRNLVFSTSATTFELNKFGDDIDAAISDVEILAQAFKERKEAEEEAKKNTTENNREVVNGAISLLPISPQQKEALGAMVRAAMGGSAVADTGKTGEGDGNDANK